MNIDELLESAAKAAEQDRRAAQQAKRRFIARIAVEDAWIKLDESLKAGGSQLDLGPLSTALAQFPDGKQALYRLRDAAQSQYSENSDLIAGLLAGAVTAIIDADAATLLRIAGMRTAQSHEAIRRLSDAIWHPKQIVMDKAAPIHAESWQEARDCLESMVDSGLQKCSLRRMQQLLGGCHYRTIKKAIHESAKLSQWFSAKEAKGQRTDQKKVTRLTDASLDGLADQRQPQISDREMRELLEELCKAGTPEEANKIRGMDPMQQAELVAAYRQGRAEYQAAAARAAKTKTRSSPSRN